MLKDRAPTQSELGVVCIGELVPADHLLRKVDKTIDFSFIHDLVKDLYCSDNGRPALDPTLLFKLLLLDHRTVDGRCNIITDVHLTPGNVHDSRPYLGRLDRQKERFGFDIQSVGLDAGYFTAGICKGLEDRSIYGVISYRRPTHRKDYFYKKEYRYDAEQDRYTCPENAELIYATTDRNGYRHYHSNPDRCLQCSQ